MLAARDQCNKHVVKMIVESAQLICTALSMPHGGSQAHDVYFLPYKPTHAKHPCTKWLCESHANIAWLFAHAVELCEEYTRRYGRVHKTQYVLQNVAWLLRPADWRDHTPFAQAMPDEWKDADDAVTAYRCYYIAEKSHMAVWEPRARKPTWWPL